MIKQNSPEKTKNENREGSPDTVVVNLYGGPGTGKSTTAAATFALLKQRGVNAELATEYAKDIVWEGRNYLLSDQIYIFAKQNRKLMRLYGKVDVIVTDCPLLLSYYYSANEHILGLIEQEMSRTKQLHIMLKRVKPYNTAGRYQTEIQAREIDEGMKQMLRKLEIEFHEINADEDAAINMLKLINLN